MSAEIVNLRRARKAKAKAGKVEKSAENRARFGRTKAEREREALEQARVRRAFEGAEREAGDGNRDHSQSREDTLGEDKLAKDNLGKDKSGNDKSGNDK